MAGYDKTIFAKNLCRYISRESLSQKEIAQSMGVSESTVSSWCDGSKMPRMDKVQTLADKFGVLKSDLIEEEASIFGPPDADEGIADDEQQLIDNYRFLNAEGQEKATDYLDDLVQSGKYKKHNQTVMDKNA